MLLFCSSKASKFQKRRDVVSGSWWFFILASSGNPGSAIALTLRWFPVARKKPIIYLLTLQKVCTQSPVARQKEYYGSNAVTESPREKRPNYLAVWEFGPERSSLYTAVLRHVAPHTVPPGHSAAFQNQQQNRETLKTVFQEFECHSAPAVCNERWREVTPLAGTFYKGFSRPRDHQHHQELIRAAHFWAPAQLTDQEWGGGLELTPQVVPMLSHFGNHLPAVARDWKMHEGQ